MAVRRLRFEEVLQLGRTVIAETYPAEYYGRALGEREQPWSKDHQESRRAVADAMLKYAAGTNIQLDERLQEAITDGFGATGCGQDRFDAVVGLLAMVEVVTGRHDTHVPDDYEVRKVEGWILGQA